VCRMQDLLDAFASPSPPPAAPAPAFGTSAGPTFKDGARVRICGLKARPELNGCLGIVDSQNSATGRFNIKVEKQVGNFETIALKPSALEPIPSEGVAAPTLFDTIFDQRPAPAPPTQPFAPVSPATAAAGSPGAFDVSALEASPARVTASSPGAFDVSALEASLGLTPTAPAAGANAAASTQACSPSPGALSAPWDGILGRWSAHRGSAQLRSLVLEGVPEAVQSRLWWTALTTSGGGGGGDGSGGMPNDEATYLRAAAQAASLRDQLEWDWDGTVRKTQPHLEQLCVVSADVPRTMPELQRDGTLNASELQSLLDAYVAASSPAGDCGGYTQGMADVAAWLLTQGLRQWEVFHVVRSLGRRPLLRSMMSLDQECWHALCSVYSTHLARPNVAPELARHFGRLGLDAFFFLPEWLVAIYCRTLSQEAARLSWNLMILDGDTALLSIALGVTRALAPALLGCADLAECRNLLRDGPRGLSLDSFREAALAVTLEPSLLRPLARWIETPAERAMPAIEL
jgi:hypothetical protein